MPPVICAPRHMCDQGIAAHPSGHMCTLPGCTPCAMHWRHISDMQRSYRRLKSHLSRFAAVNA